MVAKELFQTDISGVYYFFETLNGKPVYKHEFKYLLMFYAAWWKVDGFDVYKSATHIGWIQSTEDSTCPETIDNEKWIYYKNQIPNTGLKVIACKLTTLLYQLSVILNLANCSASSSSLTINSL